MREWRTNDEAGEFGSHSIKKGDLLKDTKSSEIVFKNGSDGQIFSVENVSLRDFLVRHYLPLLLTVGGFSLLIFVIAPYWIPAVAVTEYLLWHALKHCKEKSKHRILYAFRGVFGAEVLFMGLYLLYLFSSSNAVSNILVDLLTGFTLFNFYLFPRLYLASRMIFFGDKLYRLKDHSGFYLWEGRKCI